MRTRAVATCLSALFIVGAVLGTSTASAACHDDGPGLADSNAVVADRIHVGFAQTFVATDSLLSGLVIWSANMFGAQIAGVAFAPTDSSGMPVIGGTVPLIAGPFPVSEPTTPVPPYPYQFHFDPPVRLVRSQTYAFLVGHFAPDDIPLLVDSTGTSSPGHVWQWKFPTWPDNIIVGVLTPSESFDLCCTLTYCDGSVPTEQSTWGAIKTRYR
jgi:hypothetical protein